MAAPQPNPFLSALARLIVIEPNACLRLCIVSISRKAIGQRAFVAVVEIADTSCDYSSASSSLLLSSSSRRLPLPLPAGASSQPF
jgi:hypothetical protein